MKRPRVEKENTTLVSGRRTSMFLHDDNVFTYVAAIEIGTSYSGYAYCPRKDGKSISKDIGKWLVIICT